MLIHYLACFAMMALLQARIDGVPRLPAQATISVADEGLLRGDGVFEVIRVYGGFPFAVDAHVERMRLSAASLRLPFAADAALADVAALAAAAGGSDALIRLVQTRGGRLIALLEDAPILPASVRLATIRFSPSGLLDGVKTISYAANSLAARIAQERDADEALFVSPEGRVLEGPNFAVFFVFRDEQQLCTPPLAEGILDSITRRCVAELLPTAERAVQITEFADLAEAFIVSTVREVLPVSRLDNVHLPPPPGPLTLRAASLFRMRVRAEAAHQHPPSSFQTV